MAKKSKQKNAIKDEPWDPSDTCDVPIDELYESIKSEGRYSYDLETSGLSARKDHIEGVAFYVPNEKDENHKPLRAWYPFTEGTMDYTIDGTVVSLREPMDQFSTMEKLRPIWQLKDVIAVRANGIFDDAFLYLSSGLNEPIVIENMIADSMIADYISDERRRRYGLKLRVDQVFGHKMTTYNEAAGGQATFGFAKKKPLGAYACDDTVFTYRLWKWAIDQIRLQDPPRQHKDDWCSPLDNTPGLYSDLEKIFWKIEMKIQPILMEMEITGCFVDWEWLVKVQERINKQQDKILEEFKSTVGWVPNLRSPKQVSDFLYNSVEKGGLGLPTKGVEYNEDTEQYATGDKAISHRKAAYPLVGKMLKYRSLSVIDNSFCKKLIKLGQEEGRVYARFRQTGTVIGRLSCISGNSILSIRLYGEDLKRSVRLSKLLQFSGSDVMITTHKGRERRVLNLFNKGPDLMFEVVADDGSKIRCTRDHKFFTDSGWRALKDIKRGDRLLRAEVCETQETDKRQAVGARSTVVFQGVRGRQEADLQEVENLRSDGWDCAHVQGGLRLGDRCISRTVEAPSRPGRNTASYSDVGSTGQVQRLHTLQGIVQGDLRRQQPDARASEEDLWNIASGYDSGREDLQGVSRLSGGEARTTPERGQTERGGVLSKVGFGGGDVRGEIPSRDRGQVRRGGVDYFDGHVSPRSIREPSRDYVVGEPINGQRVLGTGRTELTNRRASNGPEDGFRRAGGGLSEADATSPLGQAERIDHECVDRERDDREGSPNVRFKSGGDEAFEGADGGWNPASATIPFLQELAGRLRLDRSETTGRGRWRVAPEVPHYQGQRSEEDKEGEGAWLPDNEVHHEADRQEPSYGDSENRVRTWTRVTSITPVSVEDVWDLTVEGDHSYLAHGFVNKNSADPVNLMNQPRDKNLIRKAFCAHLEDDYDPERNELCLIDADYCLVAGTPIITVDGVMPIEEVAVQMPAVLSSADGKSLEIRPVVAGGRVGIAPCVRVTLEDGSSVVCTEDHKWMTYGGRLVETKYLNPGDRMAHAFVNRNGNYVTCSIRGNKRYLHDLVAEFQWGPKLQGHHVDHIDANKHNNSLSNIRYLTASKNLGQGAGRWWAAATEEERAARTTSLVDGQRKNRRSYKDDGNPNYGKLKGKAQDCLTCGVEFYRPPSTNSKYCSRKCYHKACENGCDLVCERCGITYYRSDGKKTRFCSHACLAANKPVEIDCEICEKRFLPTKSAVRFCGSACSNRSRGKTVYELNCKRCSSVFESSRSNAKYCGRECWRLRNRAVVGNHRIISIEPVGPREVFQITVEGTSTYVTSCGLVSSNSQMELRMAASLAQERNMIEVYSMVGGCSAGENGDPCERYTFYECFKCHIDGAPIETPDGPKCANCGAHGNDIEHQKRCRHVDLHQRTAEDVGVPRNPLAKNSNFGLLYRMGAPKFCIYAGLFDEDGNPQIDYGQELINKWHATYPGIATWHARIIHQLVSDDYVAYNIARRRRRLDIEWKKNDYRAGTQAIQFKNSGSCQDLIKLAMIKLYDTRNAKIANSRAAESALWRKFKFLIQVHDELIFEAPKVMKEELCALVKECMESVAKGMRVPFIADARSGRTWEDLH